MQSKQSNAAANATNQSRVEQMVYISLAALLLIVVVFSLRGRGLPLTRFDLLGPITQVGSVIIVSYALFLMGFAIRRSVYARRMIISATSAIISLGLVEGALQICDCTAEVPEVQINRQALERIDYLLDQRANGVDINPAFSAVTLQGVAVEYGPDLLFSHIGNSKVMLSEEDDGLITIKTDENGFRNPPGLYSQTDKFDVFLIGDSYTEGWSVPDGFTIADNIRQTNSYTVYNGGLGGAGLVHNLAVFIEYGIPKEPANVVVVMPEIIALGRALNELKFERLNDYYTNHMASDLLAKRPYKDQVLTEVVNVRLPEARLQIVSPNRSFFDRVSEEINTTSRIVQLIHTQTALAERLKLVGRKTYKVEGNRYQGEGVPACEDDEQRNVVMRNVISWLDQRVDEYGGKLFVAYVPGVRYSGYVDWPECEHELVIETTRELNVPLIDVINVMSKADNPIEFFAVTPNNTSGHPNREGYRLIAEQIIERLKLQSESTSN